MNNKEVFGAITSYVSLGSFAMGVIDFNVILQITALIVAIISGILSITYTVFKWYKKVVSEDSDGGKSITVSEVKEGITEVIPVVKEVVQTIKEKGDKENGNKN